MCCTQIAENTGCKNLPSVHHHTTLSGYIFGWRVWVWGTPASFNGFSVLASLLHRHYSMAVLLHGTRAVGISQTLQHSAEGGTYIRQGSHHVGHWPHSSFD